MLYKEDNIDSEVIDKISRFIKLNDDEKVFIYFDDTIFSNGKRGLIGTDDRIIKYHKNKISEVPVKEIKNIISKKISKYENRLMIEMDSGVSLDYTPKSIPNDELTLIIDILKKKMNR